MSELSTIESNWVEGVLECSFKTARFIQDDSQDLTLNHIQPIGRKVLKNARLFEGELPQREQTSFLEDRYLLDLEVYPETNGEYPLDDLRKFHAKDVMILNPEISEIREVDGVRHGLLKAHVICKLKKLNDKQFKEELKEKRIGREYLISESGTGNINDSDITGKGCLPVGLSSVNSGCMNAPLGGGCLSVGLPSVNSGCMSTPLNGGCLNLTRWGCGGFISLLILLGLISLLMRTCDSYSAVKSNNDSDQVEQDNSSSTLDFDDSTSNRKRTGEGNRDIEDARLKEDSWSKTTETVEVLETQSLVLPNVQFYTNSDRLLPSSAKDLDRLCLYMLEHLEVKANIYGHTDNRGAASFNLKLSQSRANSVREYLIKRGIDPSRLKAVGKGETEPRASNDTPEGLLMNRRVEIEILKGRSVKERNR